MEKRGKDFVCKQCGKTFFVKQCDINYRPTIKYCSQECYHASTRKEKQFRHCLNCGSEFVVVSRHKDKKFCCTKCATDNRRNKKRTATLGSNGYKYVWFANGSGQKEHRFIIEQIIGRKLDRDEVVHHIDGNRSNNDISNLVVMSRGEHSALHRNKEIEKGKILFGGNKSVDTIKG